uniref:5'-AMP-activated protein kinase subunit beta-1 n=1 Tax=Romanomermis culicivorax TaxID=13658 RepID=A0A915KV08_ROMCU
MPMDNKVLNDEGSFFMNIIFLKCCTFEGRVITHGGRFLWQWFSGQRQETLLSFLQSSRKKSCTFVERHRNFLSENLFGREIPIDNQCTWDTASNLPEILGRIYMGFRILAFCALAAIERDDFTLATDEEEDIDNNDTTAKIQTFKTQKLIDYANIKKGSDQRMHVLRKVEFIWPWGPHEVLLSGSFVDWSTKLKMFRSKNAFHIALMLPKGHHEFKFFVDNRWCLSNSKEYRKCKGSVNDERNYIHVN